MATSSAEARRGKMVKSRDNPHCVELARDPLTADSIRRATTGDEDGGPDKTGTVTSLTEAENPDAMTVEVLWEATQNKIFYEYEFTSSSLNEHLSIARAYLLTLGGATRMKRKSWKSLVKERTAYSYKKARES